MTRDPDLLTRTEAAGLLGVSTSALAHGGGPAPLPGYGRRVYYSCEVCQEWLRASRAAARLVGVDVAQDGLGHASLAQTGKYVDPDLARLAQASQRIQEAILGVSKVGADERGQARKVERATRLELATLSLEGAHRASPVMRAHLDSCVFCQLQVAACTEMRREPRGAATEGGGTAQTGHNGAA